MLGVKLYKPDWKLPIGVHAAISTRNGGISEGRFNNFNMSITVGDNDEAVGENRMRFESALTGAPQCAWITQVHGNKFIEANDILKSQNFECDASWTDQQGVASVVTTADCLPVLFAAYDGSRVAAAHVGWRGLQKGLLKEVAKCFIKTGYTAFIGPCISQKNYRVDEDVRTKLINSAALEKMFETSHDGGYFADLSAIACSQLKDAREVVNANLCTYAENKEYYSARREGFKSGRFASAIWLKDPT